LGVLPDPGCQAGQRFFKAFNHGVSVLLSAFGQSASRREPVSVCEGK
jgi:hypothetical protein